MINFHNEVYSVHYMIGTKIKQSKKSNQTKQQVKRINQVLSHKLNHLVKYSVLFMKMCLCSIVINTLKHNEVKFPSLFFL